MHNMSVCMFTPQTTFAYAPTPNSLFSGLQEKKPINFWGQRSRKICTSSSKEQQGVMQSLHSVVPVLDITQSISFSKDSIT